MKDSLKNSLTNRNRDNPFRNQRENIYNFKINKKVNRSIEKKRNSNVQMSFKIEKHNEKKINSRKINETNENKNKENKENFVNNFNITSYKFKGKLNVKKINKTLDKIDIKSLTINYPKTKAKEKIKFNKEKEKEKINYFDLSKIEDNVQIPKEYINTIYYNLLKEEDNGINPSTKINYMMLQSEINERMRGILIDWLIEVHYKFGFIINLVSLMKHYI